MSPGAKMQRVAAHRRRIIAHRHVEKAAEAVRDQHVGDEELRQDPATRRDFQHRVVLERRAIVREPC
jgi:hypothetical protein